MMLLEGIPEDVTAQPGCSMKEEIPDRLGMQFPAKFDPLLYHLIFVLTIHLNSPHLVEVVNICSLIMILAYALLFLNSRKRALAVQI